jgi:hypothetical protein
MTFEPQFALACVMVNDWPFTMIAPERKLGLKFPSTRKPTAPRPTPETPELRTIQDALLLAFQAQPGPVSTITRLKSPSLAAAKLLRLNDTPHSSCNPLKFAVTVKGLLTVNDISRLV